MAKQELAISYLQNPELITPVGKIGDQGCDVLAELRRFRQHCGKKAVHEVVATRRHCDAHLMAVVCPAG